MYIKFLSITKTLRFRILFPLMLIILSVSFLEIYYLNHYAFTVVEDIVLDTKAKNASQVLNGIERYFSNIETIAKKPLNTIEISSLLRKDYTNLSITEKSKDKYSIQMFLFREIMLPNPDIESSLIYDTSEKDYYAISDTYALYKDSYYSFNAHDTDFSKLQATDGVPFIKKIPRPLPYRINNMYTPLPMCQIQLAGVLPPFQIHPMSSATARLFFILYC